MKSMTGFGRAVSSIADADTVGEIDVSIRAVNGRFFEARMHLPREYAEIESALKKRVGERIKRGTVDVYVNRRGFALEARATARPELAKSWLAAVRGLAHEVGLPGEPSLELLLKNPDVLRIEEVGDRAALSVGERSAVEAAVADAAARCDDERRREGVALAADLEGLLRQLEATVDRIESMRDEANADLARKYRERLQKLGFEGMVDAQRLAQEVAIILERADVNEELARLREHVAAYRKLIAADGAQGKKLDFYAQELLREANTIGSKSHAAKLTEAVVDAKALIERVREQVQNAE